MSSPILTDEELEKEKNLFNMDGKPSSADKKNGFMNKETVRKAEDELEKDIPSNYIEIRLISNGRIEGIPEKLHFRCYSASDALDLNVADDDKVKAVTKVLSRLNYEKFDVSLLTVQDILFILYSMHGSFISPTITKKVYVDDTIEDEKILNDESNIEEVDISLNTLSYAYLGKDFNDKDLEPKIKVPFTIKDKNSGDSVSFKFSVLKDILLADTYCRNYFKNEFIKFGDVRSALNRIRNIHDEEKQDVALDDYLVKNEDKVNEYYEFMDEYSKMVAEVTQAETIVAYNGKKLENLEEKWEVYQNNLSYDIWEKYNNVINGFPFGFKEDIDVYLTSQQKVVHRRVGFQLDDFLHINGHKDSDRYTVEFD